MLERFNKSILKLLLLVLLILLLVGCAEEAGGADSQPVVHCYVPLREGPAFGVWWWSAGDDEADLRYLDFADAQGITELYFAAGVTRPDWCQDRTSAFIAEARTRGIAVYYLTGDWSWIHDDAGLVERMEVFLAYQASACEMTRFAGVHLNVEPHQDPVWNADTRNELLQRYMDLKVRTTDQFGPMDWTIPFWYRDGAYDLIVYRGEMMYFYRAAILEATRVFVLSYRNSAEAMYQIAQHHVAFAREMGRPIFLSALVEPGFENPGYDHVFFSSLGYAYMMGELVRLRELVDYAELGIAVHEVRGWYRMWARDGA